MADDEKNAQNMQIEMTEGTGIVIDKETATKICTQNQELLEAAKNSLQIVEFMPEFDKNENTAAAKPFALAVQSSAMTLIGARGQMRNSMQLIMEIQKYSPADTESNKKRKELWTAIRSSSGNIIETTVEVLKTTATYFGFLTKIYDSVQYFVTTQKAEIDSDEPVPLSLSLEHLRRDCDAFCKFKEKLDVAIGTLTSTALKSMKAVVESAIGEANFTVFQKEYRAQSIAYNKEFQAELELKNQIAEELSELRSKLIEEQGKRDVLKVRIDFAKGKVKDLNAAIKDCESKATRYREQALKATKKEAYTAYEWVKDTKYSSSSYGYGWRYWWWGSRHYSSSTTTTNKQIKTTKYRDVEDTAKKNKLNAAKEEELRIKEAKNNLQKATQQEIDQWEQEYNTIKAKVAKQEETLKNKEDTTKQRLKKQHDLVVMAKKARDKAMKEIETICDNAGVAQDNVKDFLVLLNKLVPATLQTTDCAVRMNNQIKTFQEVIDRRTKSRLSIAAHFADEGLDKFIEPLKQNGFKDMKSLICDKDDYGDIIQPIYLSIDPKLNPMQKLALKNISLKPDSWKKKDIIAQSVARQVLLGQFPVLKGFFVVIYKRLDKACQQLRIEASSENENKIHNRYMLEYQEPKREKKLKIEEISDNDDDKSDDSDSDSDSGYGRKKKQKDKKKKGKKGKKGKKVPYIIKSFKHSKLKCRDEDDNEISIKIKSSSMKGKIEKQLKKGKKAGQDVRAIVMETKIGKYEYEYDVVTVELVSDSDSDSDSSSSSSSSDRRGRKKKGSKKTKGKKKRKKESSTEESDESEESEEEKPKKKGKKKSKKKPVVSDDSASDDDSDKERKRKKKKSKTKKVSSESEPESEDASDDSVDKKKKKKKKKAKKESSESEQSEDEKPRKKRKKKAKKDSDSDDDSESDDDSKKKKKKKTKAKMVSSEGSGTESEGENTSKKTKKGLILKKREFLCRKIDDDDMVHCIDEDFGKINFKLNGDSKFQSKIKKIVKKGKKKGKDVKLNVTEKKYKNVDSDDDDDEDKYQIIDAFIVESESDSE